MSGVTAGKRRVRMAIRPVAVPQLKPGEDGDTRVERGLADLQDAVNSIIDVVQGNIDLGNLDP